MERRVFRILSTPVRSRNLTIGVHKDDEDNSLSPSAIGSPIASLFGRFHRTFSGQKHVTEKETTKTSLETWISNFKREVKLRSVRGEGVPRSFSFDKGPPNVLRTTEEKIGGYQGDNPVFWV